MQEPSYTDTIYFISFNVVVQDIITGNINIKHTSHGLIEIEGNYKDLIDKLVDIVKKEKGIEYKPENIHIIAFNKI